MLKLVRRNKDPKKRKLVFYDGYDHKKIIAYVEPCWGWFAVYTTTPRNAINNGTLVEIRQRTMENLYWLLMEEMFKVGDVVRLADGDGRHHIIKEIIWEYDVYGNKYMASVIFEDNAAKGFICETYTDMIKVL